MEFCGGGSLQDIYHVTGALSEPMIAFVCNEMLNGLKHMHDQKKVHRDIKGKHIHTIKSMLVSFWINEIIIDPCPSKKIPGPPDENLDVKFLPKIVPIIFVYQIFDLAFRSQCFVDHGR